MTSSSVQPLAFAETVHSSCDDDFVPFVFTDDHEEFPPLLPDLVSARYCDWELVEDKDFGDEVIVVGHKNNEDDWAHVDRLCRTFAEAAAPRSAGGVSEQKLTSVIRFRHGLESQRFNPSRINRSGLAEDAVARRWCEKQKQHHCRTKSEDTESETVFHGHQRRNRKRKSSAWRPSRTKKATQTACH
ncbi:hypothetical protein BX666DRAFT_2025135 [Dichotomocladium elegans]|nr:hypothetical protein BX666DRAFT_2025135 [Dichotomocladium elegans]